MSGVGIGEQLNEALWRGKRRESCGQAGVISRSCKQSQRSRPEIQGFRWVPASSALSLSTSSSLYHLPVQMINLCPSTGSQTTRLSLGSKERFGLGLFCIERLPRTYEVMSKPIKASFMLVQSMNTLDTSRVRVVVGSAPKC